MALPPTEKNYLTCPLCEYPRYVALPHSETPPQSVKPKNALGVPHLSAFGFQLSLINYQLSLVLT
jgi:hypothetical protein